MGTLKGHVIPGMEFILLGVFLNMIYKAEQLAAERESSYTSVQLTDEESQQRKVKTVQSPTRGGTAKIKLMFAAYGICSIVIGILYEGLGGVLVKSGYFFEEIGHITMYLGFLPATIAFGLESGLFPGSTRRIVDNSPVLSQGAFALGFLNQYYLMRGHVAMKKPGADYLFHQMWADSVFLLVCVYGSSVLAKLMNHESLARALQLACPAFLLLQGIWTCMIGIIMFPVWHEMHDNIPMETVQAYFGLCLLFCAVVQYMWIEIVPAGVARLWLRSAVDNSSDSL